MDTSARLRRVLHNKQCFGPVSDTQICEAERELGVRFPPSYREFLRHYGAAFASYEIAGLPNTRATDAEPPLWSNVIDDTLAIRRVSQGRIPEAYVPISSDGGDFIFYLDTAAVDDRGECPVVILGPGVDGVQSAASFVAWVEKAEAGRAFPREL